MSEPCPVTPEQQFPMMQLVHARDKLTGCCVYRTGSELGYHCGLVASPCSYGSRWQAWHPNLSRHWILGIHSTRTCHTGHTACKSYAMSVAKRRASLARQSSTRQAHSRWKLDPLGAAGPACCAARMS